MHCTKWLILALAGWLLTASEGRAGADRLSMHSPSFWLGPLEYYHWARSALTTWQPPKLVLDLIDIAVAKPFPPMDPRNSAGKSRFGWDWLKARFDINHDDVITRQEFAGPAEFFDRLDRNHDGVLRATDFDWLTAKLPAGPPGGKRAQGFPAVHVFRTIDGDANGRLTAKEWVRYFEKLGGKKGYIALEDMRQEILEMEKLAERQQIRAHRLGNLLNRGKGPVDLAKVDRLTVPLVLLASCFSKRGPGPGGAGGMPKGKPAPGKFSPAPEPGQPAPVFALRTEDGAQKISLADYRGRWPVVLILGSLNWPGYRSQFGDMEEMYQRYKDQAAFLTVYTRDIHPVEGREPPPVTLGEGPNRFRGTIWEYDIKQPTTLTERRNVAKLFCSVLKVKMPLVVDEMDNRVLNAYGTARAYVIDESGKVAYQGGTGAPLGFSPGETEQSLIMLLLERGKGPRSEKAGR